MYLHNRIYNLLMQTVLNVNMSILKIPKLASLRRIRTLKGQLHNRCGREQVVSGSPLSYGWGVTKDRTVTRIRSEGNLRAAQRQWLRLSSLTGLGPVPAKAHRK